MTSETTFGVRVEQDLRSSGGNSGWTVTIWEHEPGQPHKMLDFAKVNASNLDLAMRMAVPYLVAAAEPDPFAGLLARHKQGDSDG